MLNVPFNLSRQGGVNSACPATAGAPLHEYFVLNNLSVTEREGFTPALRSGA